MSEHCFNNFKNWLSLKHLFYKLIKIDSKKQTFVLYLGGKIMTMEQIKQILAHPFINKTQIAYKFYEGEAISDEGKRSQFHNKLKGKVGFSPSEERRLHQIVKDFVLELNNISI
jgi:hypothetical protein